MELIYDGRKESHRDDMTIAPEVIRGLRSFPPQAKKARRADMFK